MNKEFINKDWFLMHDIKKMNFTMKTWIPLFATKYIIKNNKYGELGYTEEFFCLNTVLVDSNQTSNIDNSIRNNIIQSAGNTPSAYDNVYEKAGTFSNYSNSVNGEYLVLKQKHPLNDEIKYHINQDLILALDLFFDGHSYIRPLEDNQEVIRFDKNKDDEIEIIEIKKEFLLDYLSARNSSLIIDRFHHRRNIRHTKLFDWNDETRRDEQKDSLWESRQFEIHEGGFPKDSSVLITTSKQKDVDYDEDVPNFEINNNIEYSNKTKKFSGNILIDLFSDFWKYEILKNNNISERIRYDEKNSSIPFIVDNDGKTELPEDFQDRICWLWFKPDILIEIMKRENAILHWYSEFTGSTGLNQNYCVHFGQNKLGYINIFAKDIANLPDYIKKIWSAHNIVPDGKVTEELLMAQMECNPASTHAPEKQFHLGIDKFEQAFLKIFEKNIFRQHSEEKDLIKRIHRFNGINKEGIFQLSKHITKYFIERLNFDVLKELTPSLDKKTGSIKRLEKILNDLGENGRDLTSSFVGIYELRHNDSHLSSSKMKDSFDLLKIQFEEGKENYIKEARQIIKIVSE